MKKLIYLFAVLAAVAGCSKFGDKYGPVNRKMVAAAYHFMDTEDGRKFYFYLVDKKGNLIQNPDDQNAMKVTNYVCIEIMSDSETPQGTYSLTTDSYDFPAGKAFASDNVGKGAGVLASGTVEVGDNTITVNGTTQLGRSYKLSYSGTFQQTGNITPFAEGLPF